MPQARACLLSLFCIATEIFSIITLSLELLTVLFFALQGGLVSCLLSLLQQMDEDHYKHTWESFHHLHHHQGHPHQSGGGGSSSNALRTFLLECFLLFQVLINRSVFPVEWMLMRLKASQIMLNTMQEMAKPLLIYFR